MRERFACGNNPKAWPCLPARIRLSNPDTDPGRTSCGKPRLNEQLAVAMLQSKAMMPMLFFRLQRSTKIEAGKVRITIDQ